MTACVSLFGSDPTVLCERLQVLATRRRVVELRIDRISGVDWQQLAEASGSLDVVLAAVPRDQGGEFAGSEADWRAALEQAAPAFGERAILDIPPGVFGPPPALAQLRRLWSWHEPHGESTADLGGVLAKLRARGRSQDFYKLVAWADDHEQALRAVRLLQAEPSGKVIAFAQGPGGPASRFWAPVLGAPWTYASWAGECTAPGQWAEDEMPADSEWPTLECFGVFGDPVEHSRSPELWQAAFRFAACMQELAEGASAPAPTRSYLRLRHRDLCSFRSSYASSAFRAFSVTAPLKREALQLADRVDPLAARVGAANLLFRDADGSWVAGQTDGAGALRPMVDAGLPPEAPLLVLGAGGAARAVVGEALQQGRRVTVAARRLEQARQLAADFAVATGAQGEVRVTTLNAPDLLDQARQPEGALGIVQATPVGSSHRPGNLLQGRVVQAGDVVLDMVYAPLRTELLGQAESQGAKVVPGHYMLLAQMLRQWELTLGEAPPATALLFPLEASLGITQPPIVLCGPRASGKSTLGRWLAEVLDWPFVDADGLLESRFGRPIADWVRTDLTGFRAAEESLLPELLHTPQRVVALGGGVVESAGALAQLARHPRVLGLALSAAEQLERRRQQDNRPALTELSLADEIQLLHERRLPLYEKACAGRWIDVGGNKAESFQCLIHRLKLLV